MKRRLGLACAIVVFTLLLALLAGCGGETMDDTQAGGAGDGDTGETGGNEAGGNNEESRLISDVLGVAEVEITSAQVKTSIDNAIVIDLKEENMLELAALFQRSYVEKESGYTEKELTDENWYGFTAQLSTGSGAVITANLMDGTIIFDSNEYAIEESSRREIKEYFNNLLVETSTVPTERFNLDVENIKGISYAVTDNGPYDQEPQFLMEMSREEIAELCAIINDTVCYGESSFTGYSARKIMKFFIQEKGGNAATLQVYCDQKTIVYTDLYVEKRIDFGYNISGDSFTKLVAFYENMLEENKMDIFSGIEAGNVNQAYIAPAEPVNPDDLSDALLIEQEAAERIVESLKEIRVYRVVFSEEAYLGLMDNYVRLKFKDGSEYVISESDNIIKTSDGMFFADESSKEAYIDVVQEICVNENTATT